VEIVLPEEVLVPEFISGTNVAQLDNYRIASSKISSK
jgi:hypothetical protein